MPTYKQMMDKRRKQEQLRKEFGTLIKKARIDLDMTQGEFANNADINYHYMSQIERGGTHFTPSPELMRKIIKFVASQNIDTTELQKAAEAIFKQKIINDVNETLDYMCKVELSADDQKQLEAILDNYKIWTHWTQLYGIK